MNRCLVRPFILVLLTALSLTVCTAAQMRVAPSGSGVPVVYADAATDSALLAEGERRQAIQFNPAAALQKRVFADGFVPNSPEFGLTVNGVAYTGQRAEDLGTGRVRVYYVVIGDWGNVQTVERGAAAGAPGSALLAEGEARQIVQFNPAAALQKRVFADGFVPNSPEFSLTVNGVAYAGQRAENLGSGQVRVYYVAVGDWGNIQVATRGAPVTVAPPAAPGVTVETLVGGLDNATLQRGDVAAIEREAGEAARVTGGRRWMLGPACSVPVDAPDAAVRAARQAVS